MNDQDQWGMQNCKQVSGKWVHFELEYISCSVLYIICQPLCLLLRLGKLQKVIKTSGLYYQLQQMVTKAVENLLYLLVLCILHCLIYWGGATGGPCQFHYWLLLSYHYLLMAVCLHSINMTALPHEELTVITASRWTGS